MRKHRYIMLACTIAAVAWGGMYVQSAAQQDPLDAVLKDQAKRIAAIAKVRPSVVAVFAKGGKGGGSGVLISKDGYALTNFHVVRPAGPMMKCGLDDGVLYDAVLVGWDKVGDVALIKLLPKKEGDEFPFAPIGDSDKVREGDWSLAMGNPFLLATDFTPTVTFGMVSGVHRYQYPSGSILEYTDCIQIDTSINPGNSGGPLFNLDGELIGINGRGSFDKRGRVNSGVGYAISINQIKNFMGHLKGGFEVDHATLGAVVATQEDPSGLGRMVVTSILENSDVARRGLDYDDEIIAFDGRPINSVNQFKNVLGIFPRNWRLPLVYRSKGSRNEVLVRLMGVIPKETGDAPPKKDGPKVKPGKPGKSPASKYYKPKQGYVNHYFNDYEKDRVWNGFKKHGDYSALRGDWSLFGSVKLKQLNTGTPIKIDVAKEPTGDGKSVKEVVRMKVSNVPFKVEPLKQWPEDVEKEIRLSYLQQPNGSGGYLMAMNLLQRLLTLGPDGFPTKFRYGGSYPIYPPLENGKNPTSWLETKTIADSLETAYGPFETRWYFSQKDQKLVAMEVWLAEDTDPCEVYFSDYRQVQGKWFPHQMQVRFGNGTYGTININNIQFAAK